MFIIVSLACMILMKEKRKRKITVAVKEKRLGGQSEVAHFPLK